MGNQLVPVIAPNVPMQGEGGGLSLIWLKWHQIVQQAVNVMLQQGFTGTITTAKLTGGGTNGSITFTNGVVTAQTPAT